MEPLILDKLSDRLSPAHSALIIVDMQKDFVLPNYGAHKAGRDITAAAGIVPSIAKLLAAARGAKIPVAHVGFLTLKDHRSDSGPWLSQRRRSTASADNLCMEGSDGQQFIPELSPQGGEWNVPKHRYSAFTRTNLDLLLRSRRIQTLVITGVSTNACIESTARAAFELDYYICVPPEGVASWNKELHAATLANVNHRLGLTPSLDEIVQIWSGK